MTSLKNKKKIEKKRHQTRFKGATNTKQDKDKKYHFNILGVTVKFVKIKDKQKIFSRQVKKKICIVKGK